MSRPIILLTAMLLPTPLPAAAQVAPGAPVASVAVPGSIDTARAIVARMQIDRTMDPLFQQIMPLMISNVENAMLADARTPDPLKSRLGTDAGRKQVGTIIAEEFTAAFRQRYPDIGAAAAEEYRKLFSEPELRAILAFYTSPAGAKLLQAQPQLQQVLSEQGRVLGREAGMAAFPRIQARLAALGAPTAK
ncbi:hypothetical protein FHT00_002377 [Sphingomonas insulae]|uniref:DUF2059 domain-containing protein n=1 Tax=Sphingomonas insulae TaxID=424800 RepID=A0ABN1HKI2_9SPHN|nr:DUF2059 domain-containing protein [Sphingomonas insulae]NIJ30414.1 hypothetical protein [Sphingomonas insulae]